MKFVFMVSVYYYFEFSCDYNNICKKNILYEIIIINYILNSNVLTSILSALLEKKYHK